MGQLQMEKRSTENRRDIARRRKADRRRRRRRRGSTYDRRRQIRICMGVVILCTLTVLLGVRSIYRRFWGGRYFEREDARITAEKPDFEVDLLDINDYSRPGTKSDRITGIVIHYTANPGSTAKQNRDYFNGLKDSHATSVSSHFVVGIDGEIVQCIPTWEIAYASNERNHDTVSIECCHPSEDGEFTAETYRSVIQLTAWLCQKFDLTEKDVIRHYDVTGKNCPKYFVEHEDAWEQFRTDVKKALEAAEG